MDDIDELRAALTRDPTRVAQAAGRIASRAHAAGDHATRSRALAVRGRARRCLGEVDLAAGDLAAAVTAAEACGDDELAADAHLGLAGVLAFTSHSDESFRHLDAARRLGSDRTRVHAALQGAAIRQRAGDRTGALAAYEAVLPELRALDLRPDIAKVLLNRGALRIHLGAPDLAVADYTEAGHLFAQEGDRFGAAEARHGLGWAHARRGDLPRALDLLDRAAEEFRVLGHAAPEVAVDRVEVLLAAGLSTAAADLAAATAARLAAAGNQSRSAETWLLCARAAMLDGDRHAAARHADRARVAFQHLGSAGWERAARLELLRCRTTTEVDGADADGPARPAVADVDALVGLAAEFDALGNTRAAVTASALAAVAACDTGDHDRAAGLAAGAGRRARRLGIFEVRMLARYADARVAVARGDRATARRRVRAGHADLCHHRGTLAATDARAGVAVHAHALAALGLDLALRRGSAADVLESIDRARSGAGIRWDGSVHEDGELSADLAELRSVVAAVRAGESAGTDTGELLSRQGDLERAVHRRQLRRAVETGAARWRWPGTAALRRALDGRHLVAVAATGGRLAGVGLFARRTTLVDLGPTGTVTGAADAAASALRTIVTPSASPVHRRRSLDLLRTALAVLGQVMAPLLRGDGPLVLVVPQALQAVPWHLLPLPAPRPVAVAPSATWWFGAQAGAGAAPDSAAGPDSAAATVVAGPRLAEADNEAVAVARSYPRARLRTGPAATAGAVLAAVPHSRILHLACHARVRTDNPLWSSLELSDGPLWAYDLERLPRTPPTVVLSGCHTGVGVRAGDQTLGLASALLRHDTRQVVAGVCRVPDTASTVDTMAALHGRLAAGTSPATALAELSAGAVDPDGVPLGAYLTCFGTT